MACNCISAKPLTDHARQYTPPKVRATQELIALGRQLSKSARGLQVLRRSELLDHKQIACLAEARRLIGRSVKALKESGADIKKMKVEINDKSVPISDFIGLVPKSIEDGTLNIQTLNNPKEKSEKEQGKGEEGKGFVIEILVAALIALAVVISKWIGEKITDLFNATDDDDARKWASDATSEKVRLASDSDLVNMIRAMLDGPTGEDDENAILKLLELMPCERRVRIVGKVGQDWLLDDINGANWDRLTNLLLECGLISFNAMDDDASRLFVNTHDCAQLGSLDMGKVHQLVLNMFSGSCGDDDENAILKLLRCQSRDRLNQLVRMNGTDVDEFDWNFDGDEWDDLDQLFRANGITLDP